MITVKIFILQKIPNHAFLNRFILLFFNRLFYAKERHFKC